MTKNYQRKNFLNKWIFFITWCFSQPLDVLCFENEPWVWNRDFGKFKNIEIKSKDTGPVLQVVKKSAGESVTVFCKPVTALSKPNSWKQWEYDLI